MGLFKDGEDIEKKLDWKGVARREFMKISAKAAAIMSIAPTCLLSACHDYYDSVDPFNNGSNKRDLIIVISDLHLGADLEYSETNENLKLLENFLNQIRYSNNIKELVIAGDLLDEWFVPADTDTYQGEDQANFADRIAKANEGVIEVFKNIIQDGIITVVYTPGNHDLTFTDDNVDRILPGITQARDVDAFGLGTYSPESSPEIAIEHGHRYNFFCAPDPFSNQVEAPETILPPGYFFTRLAVQHIVESCTVPTDVLPTITPNSLGGDSQNFLYVYSRVWNYLMNIIPIAEYFDDNIIVTNIDGFFDSYSVHDLLPSQTTPGGVISVNLFEGIQDKWAERCERNNVAVPIPTMQAIEGALSTTQTDNMAATQYFMNSNSNTRLVVFGHTHETKIIASENYKGEKAVYVNSGTWIDHKEFHANETTMNFVIITPQSDDFNSQTVVAVYNFENEIITEMKKDSLRF